MVLVRTAAIVRIVALGAIEHPMILSETVAHLLRTFGCDDIMNAESSQATDSLFAESLNDQQWMPTLDVNDVIKRIDDTLDLIAEATTAATESHPVDEYDLTIIVPVYNERSTLPKVLERIDEVMPRATETIVVDDGSIDGTSEWLAEQPPRDNLQIIRRRANHGKGSAVRLAIRYSRGRVIAIQDADLEYDPADLLRVMWPILEGDADVVYGSRYLKKGSDPSFIHRLGNRVLTACSNHLTGLRLTDMETCHKAFAGDLLRSISLRECRFGFEPEITAKVARRDTQILEVPTGYQSRGYDEGKKIGWQDALETLACMWKYRNG